MKNTQRKAYISRTKTENYHDLRLIEYQKKTC